MIECNIINSPYNCLQAYTIQFLLAIYWIPLMLIVWCYLNILREIFRRSGDPSPQEAIQLRVQLRRSDPKMMERSVRVDFITGKHTKGQTCRMMHEISIQILARIVGSLFCIKFSYTILTKFDKSKVGPCSGIKMKIEWTSLLNKGFVDYIYYEHEPVNMYIRMIFFKDLHSRKV